MQVLAAIRGRSTRLTVLAFALSVLLGCAARSPGPATHGGLPNLDLPTLGGAQFSALQQDLKDVEVGSGWLYGDLDAGIARAKESGQPLFVLFRCVP